MKRWNLALMVLLTMACSSSWAAGLIVVEDTHWWPGTIPPTPWPPRPFPRATGRLVPSPGARAAVPFLAPLQVTYVKVDTRIKDQLGDHHHRSGILQPLWGSP